MTKHLTKLTLPGALHPYRYNSIRLKREANAGLIPSTLRWWHVSGGVTLVHERSDELAAVLSRQLALKKSRHRFAKSLRAEQRCSQQRGDRAGHRRRVHVTVLGGRTNWEHRRDEFNYPNDEEGTAGEQAEAFCASRRRWSQAGSCWMAT